MSGCLHDAPLVSGSCYYCLKCRALNGSRSKLSDEALEFCGLPPPRPPEPGWRPAWTLLVAADDEDQRDPKASRGIRWLMKVGADWMELTT